MSRKIVYIFILLSVFAKSQTGLFINGPATSLRVDSTSFLSVHGDFQNLNCDPINYVRFNGTLYLAGNLINNDTLKFTAAPGSGNAKKARIIFTNSALYPAGATATLGGLVQPQFWEVECDKGNSGSLTLNNSVKCLDTLNFKTGLLYMNGYKWNLKDPVGAPMVINHPYVKNERNGCQFAAISLNDTGQVIYKTIYTYSVDLNPGNIGIAFKGLMNIGSPFTVYRGFKPQVNAAKSSVLRYFDVYSPGHSLVNTTITTNYVYNDMNYFAPGYFNLSSLGLYASPNTDMNWSPLPSLVQNTLVSLSGPVLNGALSANLSDLALPNITLDPKSFRITIADPNCPNPPVSALLLDTLHICTGNTVTLDAGNNSAVPNTSLKWEWNTTIPAYTQTTSVTPTTGYQKYKVLLKDVKGCLTKDSVIIAPMAPYPQITYLNHLNSCFGDSVTIKDTVKIVSGSYTNNWLFSDASTSSTLQQLFKKKFPSTGLHSYQLTATSNYGCSATATSTNVIVYPLPTASFTHSFNCSSGAMSFSSTSVSNYSILVISSSLWHLGQGSSNTSTLTNPSQTYTSSGVYSVTLLSTSSFGCKDSITTPITIYPNNQASFIKNNSCFNDTVFFNNTSACNTGSCSYTWSFGDASLSTLVSPKKVYASPGLYVAKLKVTNPVGCPDSLSVSVFVNPKPVAQFTCSNQNVCVNELTYFTNSSSISSGSIVSYNWNFANTTTSTGINAATTYSNSGIYPVSLTAISDSGCVHSVSIPVNAQPQPIAQYTVNNVCFGTASQFVSTSTGSGLNYVWNFGNSILTTTQTSNFLSYTYPSTGTYTTELIAISSWGCSDTTSVITTVMSSPSLALGGTVSTCGTSYTLNALNPGSSYLWQPGNQISQTIVATNSGTYQASITNTNTCIGTETVQVILNAIVKPHLGNDTTVCGPYTLNAGYPGSTYLWNNSSSTQTLLATTSGAYSVQVTDQNGCTGSDTINLIINTPPTLSLGNNSVTCKPKYGLALLPVTNAGVFLWNTGSTSSVITVNNSGNYWLEATAVNGCKLRDTVSITFLNTPQIELGPNRSACGNLILDAQNTGANYLWSTGSTNQVLTIFNSDRYWITVTNTLTNCFQQDTIDVTVHPLVNIFLGNDTTVCNNSNFILTCNNPGASYVWTSGQSTQTIPITSSGVYGATVTNSGNCSASDFITVTLVGAPVVDIGNNMRYLCGTSPVELSTSALGTTTWSSTTGFSSTSNTVSLNLPGKYWVTVSNFGCNASDSVVIVPSSNTIQALFLASTQDTINKPVKFVNLSTPLPTSQLWSFGDGLTSSDFSPVHTFVLPQDYSVTLEVSNGFCTDRITKQLSALFKQINFSQQPVSSLELVTLNLYPNPANTQVTIDCVFNALTDAEVQVFDISGKQIVSRTLENQKTYFLHLKLDEFSNGMYFLVVNAQSVKGNVSKTLKFIKTN